MRVLVTGSGGTIGAHVTRLLRHRGHVPVSFDLPDDVLSPSTVRRGATGVDACIHLAAHKHAPYGEEQPADVAELNIVGTRHVAETFGSRVVLASTCKAADPMTCYGASKLIAERAVLNAGGRVVRLVNVLGSSGSVVDLWRQLPPDAPLPVTDCERMWMTAQDAASMFVDALGWPTGRYGPRRQATAVSELAEHLYPGRPRVTIPLRRGDRPVERLVAEYETFSAHAAGVLRIVHPADLPAVESTASLRAA